MSEHELWNELGNLYFLSGAYRQAVHAYNRSIQMDEAFGRPYSNLALAYVQQGQYEEAVDLYRRSIDLLTENKEKAISWNRLGNVYRYLKNYQQAVVAYRRADELDPDSAGGHDEPGWVSESAREALPRNGGRASTPVDSNDAQTPRALPAAVQVAAEKATERESKSTASWAIMESTPYQQDISEALEPGSLTTWGDPGIETDDPDGNWPPELETEIVFPDADSDELTKWLPLPEEQPQDALEYPGGDTDWAVEADESPVGWDDWESPELFGEVRLAPPAARPSEIETGAIVRVLAKAPAKSDARARLETMEHGSPPGPMKNVTLEEAPKREFVVAGESRQTDEVAVKAQPEPTALVGDPTAAPSPAAAEAATAVDLQRDAEEMREIEAGLAKFQRVVQINPRNARAWDTLGNLHKSAGQYKEALLAYEQAIMNDPSKALYHHHLGLVYASEGRMEDAVDAFQRVIAIEPDHGLAHAALGGYYRKMGLEELAQKHVGKAMKSIFDSENEYNRACLAAICGNADQALELLRVALKNKQTYVDWILRDPDLDFIRQDPRFKQLISDYAR